MQQSNNASFLRMSLRVSPEAIELIKLFEGLKLTRYICAGGYATIGYGHKIKVKENLLKISKEEAELLLDQDLVFVELAVLRHIKFPLKQYQFDALASFTFNAGGAALQRSTIRRKINCGRIGEAENEIRRWVYCNGVRLRGMVIRRSMEAEMFAGRLNAKCYSAILSKKIAQRI